LGLKRAGLAGWNSARGKITLMRMVGYLRPVRRGAGLNENCEGETADLTIFSTDQTGLITLKIHPANRGIVDGRNFGAPMTQFLPAV
jgi:hypothetical protein